MFLSFDVGGYSQKIIIGIVYRHVKYDATTFIEAFSNLIVNINSKNYDIHILSDLNINILHRCRTNVTNKHLETSNGGKQWPFFNHYQAY